jgi:fused signal recognition particle receptor
VSLLSDLERASGLPHDAFVMLALAVLAGVVFVLLYLLTPRRGGAAGADGAGAAAAARGGASPLAQLMGGLAKTRARLGMAIRKALGREPTDETVAELEQAMLEADLGVATTEALIGIVRTAWREGGARTTEALLGAVRGHLASALGEGGNALRFAPEGPTVILVVGVNGAGKTTSIAKLTWWLRAQGKKVMLAAGDTFRAAAVEQLRMWSERLGVPIVKGETGGDPAAVAFDATEAAIARKVDVLIVDTAGRLHTQQNLMKELEKVKRVIQKRIPDAPHETILVLDATTGQNAIQQAKSFGAATNVTGIFLAKLDGTAKGGIVVAIKNELRLPVKFVGLGEKPEDIQPFDPARFAEALLA